MTNPLDSFIPFRYQERDHHIRLNEMVSAIRAALGGTIVDATQAGATQAAIAQQYAVSASTSANMARAEAIAAADAASQATNSVEACEALVAGAEAITGLPAPVLDGVLLARNRTFVIGQITSSDVVETDGRSTADRLAALEADVKVAKTLAYIGMVM